MQTVTRRSLLGAGIALAGGLAAPALAQAWPSRPIRVVVPANTGSYDAYIRLAAPRLSELLGQPVVVENRFGANGILGMAEVRRSDPDGHTILFAPTGSLVINVSVYRDMPFDPVEALAPITLSVVAPQAWVTHPESRIRSLADLIALARAEPGKVDYALPASGSLNHLVIEAFKQRHRIELVPVPYRSGPAAQIDVMAGRVPVMVDALGASMGHITEGRLRPLALTTRARSAMLPEVPTAIELGLEEREYMGWYAFMAPKDTPPDRIARLNAAINAVFTDPAIAARLRQSGAEPRATTPEELRAFMVSERDSLRQIALAAGLEPQ